jgi:hypothetical protein
LDQKREAEKKSNEDLKIIKEKNDNETQEIEVDHQKKVMNFVEIYDNDKRLFDIENNRMMKVFNALME